ncbi:hypothetical protein CHARACLAT_012709 [Characodon lateralis]|uniref:Uncharacterized protein n=1 Tax=Characodon lateralis TaxID=208331 RepID=A0ABU7DQL0_9TELE|nr:hypothetical protein [Characodon lateralis]
MKKGVRIPEEPAGGCLGRKVYNPEPGSPVCDFLPPTTHKLLVTRLPLAFTFTYTLFIADDVCLAPRRPNPLPRLLRIRDCGGDPRHTHTHTHTHKHTQTASLG